MEETRDDKFNRLADEVEEKLSEKVEDTLQESGIALTVGQLEDAIRRRPVASLGIAALAGFICGCLIDPGILALAARRGAPF